MTDPKQPETAHDFIEEVVSRLTARARPAERYRVQNEVATGGMGEILRVWDEDLRRSLAMKLALNSRAEDSSSDAKDPDRTRRLARFIEEAQITGQLDHPGIVPVHELGVDANGRVFFTMRLIAGRDLQAIFRLVRTGEEGWSQTRAVWALLKSCDALAYAHSKRVIHRDLKPANIMVGRFGEVYVMDWGLARILDEQDRVDVRPREIEPASKSFVMTHRRDASSSGGGSALVTMEGDILGTPAYMPPEQARGELEAMGPHSDVYSLGAILYELLAGHMPYVPPGEPGNALAVWTSVQGGPPHPLAQRAPDAPPELVAICEKAMQRVPDDRYASMEALAEDLRAYLEGRVVSAYRTGASAKITKWVARNRALAFTGLGAVALLTIGSTVSAYVLAEKNDELKGLNQQARDSEQLARRNAAIADQRAAQVLRLSDITQLEQLERAAEDLWPASPAMVGAYEAWLTRARELAARRQAHEDTLAEIRLGALDPAPGAGNAPATWAFASTQDQWQHDTLQQLVERLRQFSAPASGLMAHIEERWEFARSVRWNSIEAPDVAARWRSAIESIADRRECPAYGGLRIEPQIGLVPLGRNAASGLWEFAHLQTGAPAARDEATGRLVVTDDTGLVFVLLPGAWFWMGAQSEDPGLPNFDEHAETDEGPVTEVELAPFFVSKYEMTQGQWRHFTRTNPSVYGPARAVAGVTPFTLTHPVEQVSWIECTAVLKRLALELPTEAQWEYAARAGTDTPWCTGAERESLRGAANLADRSAARIGASWPMLDDWPELDDGAPLHAPVGSFSPNPFGLYDMHGNVWEWCRDVKASYFDPVSADDGERTGLGTRNRINRGGSYTHSAGHARSAHRNNSAPDMAINHLGLRPARPLDR